MIVLDTSVVVAALNGAEAEHAPVRAWMEANDEQFISTPLAITEMDYLVGTHGGLAAAAALWSELDAGAYLVEWWEDAMRETVEAANRFAALGIGLTDASLVALARQAGTTRIATLDHRHFRRLAPLTGEPGFVLLPADA